MSKPASKKPNQKVAVAAATAETPETVVVPLEAPASTAAPEAVVTPVAALAIEKPGKAKVLKEARESKEKKVALKKPKLVRDSFTFPEADYAQIAALKQRALNAGREIKKTEVLRAGLAALSALSDVDLLVVLDGIDKLKPGRPAK